MPNGTSYIDFLAPAVGSQISTNIRNAPVPYVDYTGDIGVFDSGSKTQVLAAALEAAHTGSFGISFLDDYYYRFHLTPATVEFGYILSPTVETFYLWNAYFVSKDCTAINQINGDEYALSGLTAPFTLSGLEEIMYTVTAPLEGAADFESSIDFDFGVDDDYVLVT